VRAYLRPALLCSVALAVGLRADWRDDIGYTRLTQTVGSELPLANSAGLTQVEAREGNPSTGAYAPNTTDPLLTNKSFVLKSGASGGSGHAFAVATNFYGDTTSLLPNALTVDLYSANEWLYSEFLQLNSNSLPNIEARQVQNHSWISIFDRNLNTFAQIDATVTNVNRRLDFASNRDGFLCVAGANNGNSTTLPDLLAQIYHGITVGLTNGAHSAGFTEFDGAGRIKPEIVAPDTLTSFATPMVSSVGAVLMQRLGQAPYNLAGAERVRVTKALLLTGARKDRVATWANSGIRPLDLRYGAGEVNAFHAYSTLRSGRHTGANTQTVPARGWAAQNVTFNAMRTYFFNVPAGVSTPFAATLTWHRAFAVGNSNSATLANLDLRLHATNGFVLGTEITASRSAVDNLEHLHIASLAPGSYALVVGNIASADTAYALAWQTLPGVTVGASQPQLQEQGSVAATVTLTRTGDTTLPLIVPLTFGGTALASTHYATPPSTVTIPANAASATLTLTPIADTLAQGDRTILVSIAEDFTLVRDPANLATLTLKDRPYDDWRFARFSTAQLAQPSVSDPSADPDGDGTNNLQEYAFGREPFTGENSPLAAHAVTADGRLTLNYFDPTGREDVAYWGEYTPDLSGVTWQSGARVVAEVSRTATSGGEWVTLRAEADPATALQHFLRVRTQRGL
jgi:hypothetical protein